MHLLDCWEWGEDVTSKMTSLNSMLRKTFYEEVPMATLLADIK